MTSPGAKVGGVVSGPHTLVRWVPRSQSEKGLACQVEVTDNAIQSKSQMATKAAVNSAGRYAYVHSDLGFGH